MSHTKQAAREPPAGRLVPACRMGGDWRGGGHIGTRFAVYRAKYDSHGPLAHTQIMQRTSLPTGRAQCRTQSRPLASHQLAARCLHVGWGGIGAEEATSVHHLRCRCTEPNMTVTDHSRTLRSCNALPSAGARVGLPKNGKWWLHAFRSRPWKIEGLFRGSGWRCFGGSRMGRD